MTRDAFDSPAPEEVRAARKRAGLTQAQAARLVYSSARRWQTWEAPSDAVSARLMHPALWELFNIKTQKLTNGKK